jgi:hypothetical protein
MIMLHPLAARVKKPVGIFWSGLFAIKPPSHLSNKENQRFRFGPSLGFCPAFSDIAVDRRCDATKAIVERKESRRG